MSFGPFRISCVSRQICNTTAVCVRSMSGGGVLFFGLLRFSHSVLMTVLVKDSVNVLPVCFLGIRAGQNRLLYQGFDGGVRECKSSDLF